MSKENYSGPIKHMVMLKWKEGTTAEQIEAFGLWNREMADDIGFGYQYENGPTVDPRYHSAYFDYCIMMNFGGGYEEMDAFMSHWSHLRDDARALEVTKIVDRAMAFNFECTPYGRMEYDPALAKEDLEKEEARCNPIHPDPNMAYVPDLRGEFMEDAIKKAEKAGVVLDPEPSITLGNSWAPGRINWTVPKQFTEVPRGTVVKADINGDYLMGIDVPYLFGDDVKGSPLDLY